MLAGLNPQTVVIVADILGGDGTSNGAIQSLVNKVCMIVGAVMVAVFAYAVLKAYMGHIDDGGGGGRGGGGGGGDTAVKRRILDLLVDLGWAEAALVVVYAVVSIVINVVQGTVS